MTQGFWTGGVQEETHIDTQQSCTDSTSVREAASEDIAALVLK